MQPTTFVQQMNTVSAMVQGRVAFNIVAGSSSEEQHGYGDFLSHDERYARAEEFLAVCNAFWRSKEEVNFDGKYYRVEQGKIATPFVAPDRTAPEIYVSGHSERSERLAWSEGTCWLRVAETPEKLAPIVGRAVFAALRQVSARTPVLLVEQNTTQALAIATRAAALVGGTIVMSGTAAELSDRGALLDSYLGQAKVHQAG